MPIIQESLFDSFSVDMDNTKNILTKLKSPKKVKEVTVEKQLSSNDVPFDEKLRLVTTEVNRILGHFKDDTICIYDYSELEKYIDKAIQNGVISVDTETIGTRDDIDKPATDAYTCKLAGPCLYTPGMKNAYIPINHVDPYTNIRLENQLSEDQLTVQFKRLVNNKVKVIYHNGKFDYKVLYYTCGVKLPIYWDTMIGAQILNENEQAGLKFQYKDKINPEQEKYNIEKLFNVEMFPKYPPELFALYAATDAYETYKLYEYQKSQYEKRGNERLYNLFLNIEMPVVTVVSEMEIRGVGLDNEFAQRLSKKFHLKLDDINHAIEVEMGKYREIISEWRSSSSANFHPTKNGKQQKSMNEQLSDPIELTSSIQLGIFLYDILQVLKVDKDGKKVVDEATLLIIKDKLPLINLILRKREYEKYLGTYIDAIPLVASPRDGRIHPKFNQLGREDKNVVTGRFSSTSPNFQNIPARGQITSVRCMFVPTINYNEFNKQNNGLYEIPVEEECLMADGSYKWVSELQVDDILDGGEIVKSIGKSTTGRLIRVEVA